MRRMEIPPMDEITVAEPAARGNRPFDRAGSGHCKRMSVSVILVEPGDATQ
jgi:hypothetical protein